MQPLTDETFSKKTVNKSNQARVDFSAHSFSLTSQVAVFYVVVDLFTTLQAHTQRICCLYLQTLHQMLAQLYYPFEFHILHTLHAGAS